MYDFPIEIFDMTEEDIEIEKNNLGRQVLAVDDPRLRASQDPSWRALHERFRNLKIAQYTIEALKVPSPKTIADALAFGSLVLPETYLTELLSKVEPNEFPTCFEDLVKMARHTSGLPFVLSRISPLVPKDTLQGALSCVDLRPDEIDEMRPSDPALRPGHQ